MRSEGHELWCNSKLHGVVVRPGVLEIACQSRFCGKKPGMIIRHLFDLETGQLIDTREYKTIETKKEDQ